jgi:hypothetical protein
LPRSKHVPGSLERDGKLLRPQANRVTQGRFALGSAAISLPTVCFCFQPPTRVSRTLILTITDKGLPFIRYAGRLIRQRRGLDIGRRQLLPLSSNFSTGLKINIRAYMHEDNTLLILLSAHTSPRDTLKYHHPRQLHVCVVRLRKLSPRPFPIFHVGSQVRPANSSPESDISVTREICRRTRPSLSHLSIDQTRHHLCAQARTIMI